MPTASSPPQSQFRWLEGGRSSSRPSFAYLSSAIGHRDECDQSFNRKLTSSLYNNTDNLIAASSRTRTHIRGSIHI